MPSRAACIAFLAPIVIGACGPKAPAPPPAPPPVALHLDHACAIVPAAGLAWIVDAKPRAIAESIDLIPAIAMIVSEERFAAFAQARGGIDLRRANELCVAGYETSTLSVVRTTLDPARVERAFEERSTRPPQRTVLAPNPVVRLAGDELGAPRTVTLFGRDAVALENAERAIKLRAAEAFAFGRLHRSKPALESPALSRAIALVEAEAPLRAFAPGPFDGSAAKGLGGLLRGATAVGASARPLVGAPELAVRLVLVGGWGKDAAAAAERLRAAFQLITESAAGRLFGLDRPIAGPGVKVLEDDALVLDATFDAMALARGLRDALGTDGAGVDFADILRPRR